MLAAVPRRFPGAPTPLVLDGALREPREGRRLSLPPAERILTIVTGDVPVALDGGDGGPSRFNTLRALGGLTWYGRGTGTR